MEGETWKLWGRAFLDYSKALGSKIADGAVFAAEKTKEGAIFVAEKTKEGALYVSEKSKPATDKIKEGASYVGTHVKSAYIDVKTKITGEPASQPVISPKEDQPQMPNFSEVQSGNSNPDPNSPLINQPFSNQQQPVYSENLDNPQNVNEENNNFYPSY